MEEFLSHLHLTKPVFLLLLFLLPLLWMRWRGRSWALILWRCLTFSMLVIALADPAWVTEQKVSAVTKEGERIFAFDLSRSIPMQMRHVDGTAYEGKAFAIREGSHFYLWR